MIRILLIIFCGSLFLVESDWNIGLGNWGDLVVEGNIVSVVSINRKNSKFVCMRVWYLYIIVINISVLECFSYLEY